MACKLLLWAGVPRTPKAHYKPCELTLESSMLTQPHKYANLQLEWGGKKQSLILKGTSPFFASATDGL